MADIPSNPWLQRFEGLDDHDLIRARVTVRGRPIADIETMPRSVMASTVKKALRTFYIPTAADLEILKSVMQDCQAHCYSRYNDKKQYFNELYIPYSEFEAEFSEPICLTGPAGVGKTALLAALGRLVPTRSDIDLGSGHSTVPLISNWHIQVRERAGLNALLSPLVDDELGDSHRSTNRLVRLCAKVAHKNGIALLVCDEMQAMTQSPLASTLVTKTLYQLAYLGLPFVFAANYSLCHLLCRRPEQDTQRILTKPIVLLPPKPDSPDWLAYLLELKRILGPSLQVDWHQQRHDIHSLTAGLKRLVNQLLTTAYSRVWDKGRRHVTMDDIKDAYDSTGYAINRAQIDSILNPYSSNINKANTCPFPLPKIAAASVINAANVEREKKVLKGAQRDALTRQEREHLATAKKSEPVNVMEAAPPRAKPRRPALSVGELQKTNAIRFRSGIYPK